MNMWLKKYGLAVAAAILALGALWPNLPYAYYQVMNWVVAIAAISTAWRAYKKDMVVAAFAFGLVAVVFNPIAPLYLRADMWQLADVIVAVLFLISLKFAGKK